MKLFIAHRVYCRWYYIFIEESIKKASFFLNTKAYSITQQFWGPWNSSYKGSVSQYHIMFMHQLHFQNEISFSRKLSTLTKKRLSDPPPHGTRKETLHLSGLNGWVQRPFSTLKFLATKVTTCRLVQQK